MNETDKILINAYLDNETSQEENDYVDELIKSDADAHKYYNLIKRVNIDIDSFYLESKTKRKNLSKIEYSADKPLFYNFFNKNFLSASLAAALILSVSLNINNLYNQSNNELQISNFLDMADFSDKNIKFDYVSTKSASMSDLDNIFLESLVEAIENKSSTATITFGNKKYKISLNNKIVDDYNIECYSGKIFDNEQKEFIFCNNNNILSISYK